MDAYSGRVDAYSGRVMTRFGKSDDAFTAVVSAPRPLTVSVWLVDDICMAEPGNDGDIMIVAPYKLSGHYVRQFDPTAQITDAIRVPRSYHRWHLHRCWSVDVSESKAMRYAVLVMIEEDWQAVGSRELTIPVEHL